MVHVKIVKNKKNENPMFSYYKYAGFKSGVAEVIRFYLIFIDYINYTLECHSIYVQGISYLLSRKGYFQGMSSSVLHRTFRV